MWRIAYRHTLVLLMISMLSLLCLEELKRTGLLVHSVRVNLCFVLHDENSIYDKLTVFHCVQICNRTSHRASASDPVAPWYHANRMLSFYAPGWCGEVRDVIYADSGKVMVVYRVTV